MGLRAGQAGVHGPEASSLHTGLDRSGFVEKIGAEAEGASTKVAQMAWNLSVEKKNLLKGVKVCELVKRRFLPKGSTSNPWAA